MKSSFLLKIQACGKRTFVTVFIGCIFIFKLFILILSHLTARAVCMWRLHSAGQVIPRALTKVHQAKFWSLSLDLHNKKSVCKILS